MLKHRTDFSTLKNNKQNTNCYNCFNCLTHATRPNHFYCVHEKHSETLDRDLTKEDPINIWDMIENRGLLVPWCFEYEGMGYHKKDLIEEMEINFSGARCVTKNHNREK